MTLPRASGQGVVMRMAAALALTLGCLLAAAATAHAVSRQTVLGSPGLVAASDDGSTATVFSAGRSVRIPARRAQVGHGFTVELWAYLLRYGDTGRSRKVASRGGQAAKSNWQLALAPGTPGRVTYSFGDGTRTVARVSHANLALGRWYQLGFVHVPHRRIELYVNGKLDSKLRTPARPVAAAAPMVLGGARHGTSARYDALALYDDALAAREIRAQFASASVGAAGVTPAFEPAFMQAAASGFAPPATSGFVPDTTPPDTTIVDRPPDPTNDSTPAFQLRASEAGSTFACRLDGASWHACGAAWTTSSLADGRHVLVARA